MTDQTKPLPDPFAPGQLVICNEGPVKGWMGHVERCCQNGCCALVYQTREQVINIMTQVMGRPPSKEGLDMICDHDAEHTRTSPYAYRCEELEAVVVH